MFDTSKFREKLGLRRREITTELVVSIIESRKGRVYKKFKYLDIKAPFFVFCEKKHRWRSSWQKISQGKWCPVCSHCKVYEKDVINFIGKKGGLLDKDFKYVNCNEKFWITCKFGHRWRTDWDHIKQGHWCPICFGMVKDASVVVDLINSKGGTLEKNWKYESILKKFEVTCNKGHTWKTCVSYLRSEFWCPMCSRFKNEGEFRGVIEKIFGCTFSKARPPWLRLGKYSQLELDGYNADLKIAFEYQGKQHYKVGKFFKHTDEYFKNLQERDKIKKKLCIDNRVALLVVPYWHPKVRWGSLIRKKLKAYLEKTNL